MIRRSFLTLLAALATCASYGAEAPKKMLVVTVTTGFRHSSIETAEKVLAELGTSSGAFTVDFVHQPPGQPKSPGRPPEKKPKETDEAFKARQETFSTALADFNAANATWTEQAKATALPSRTTPGYPSNRTHRVPHSAITAMARTQHPRGSTNGVGLTNGLHVAATAGTRRHGAIPDFKRPSLPPSFGSHSV